MQLKNGDKTGTTIVWNLNADDTLSSVLVLLDDNTFEQWKIKDCVRVCIIKELLETIKD